MRVLVADDDPVTRKMIATTLAPYLEIVEAKDGEVALEAFSESIKDNNPFHFVVLDISMPKIDGLDVLAAIRVIEEEYGIVGSDAIKSVIVTGHTGGDDIFDAHSLDCSAYLVKPVNPKRLLKEMSRLGLIPKTAKDEDLKDAHH